MQPRAIALGIALGLVASRASAEPAEDRARAEALRTDARAAESAGDYERACPLFAQAHELDPTPAALLALARCEERWGKTESAAEHTRMASELALSSQERPGAAGPPRPPVDREPPAREGLSVPVAFTGGVGVIGLVVGLVGGGLAMSAKSDIEAHCSGTACDAEGKRAADRGQAFAAVSTVGFVLGALGIGGAIALAITDTGGRRGPQRGTSVSFGLTASGIGGRF
jgi:hypothetical protein